MTIGPSGIWGISCLRVYILVQQKLQHIIIYAYDTTGAAFVCTSYQMTAVVQVSIVESRGRIAKSETTNNPLYLRTPPFPAPFLQERFFKLGTVLLSISTATRLPTKTQGGVSGKISNSTRSLQRRPSERWHYYRCCGNRYCIEHIKRKK